MMEEDLILPALLERCLSSKDCDISQHFRFGKGIILLLFCMIAIGDSYYPH